MLGDLKLIYGTGEDTSFIIRYFEDFYCEVVRQKARVLGYEPTEEMASAPEDTGETEKKVEPKTDEEVEAKETGEEAEEEEPKKDEEVETSIPVSAVPPEEILQTLRQLLNRQAIDAARYGGEFASKYYKEAEFVMAALADEIFLHFDWSGKKFWEKNLLESQVYGTHMSGETFFEKLDDFLKVRDPTRADIAMIYLLALGLGFKGKFRGIDDRGQLERYRKELYIFINHRDPTLFHDGAQLLPDAYLHTLEEGKLMYLHDFRPWMILFTILFLIMLLISYSIWHVNTADVHAIAKNIIAVTDIKP